MNAPIWNQLSTPDPIKIVPGSLFNLDLPFYASDADVGDILKLTAQIGSIVGGVFVPMPGTLPVPLLGTAGTTPTPGVPPTTAHLTGQVAVPHDVATDPYVLRLTASAKIENGARIRHSIGNIIRRTPPAVIAPAPSRNLR